MNMCYWKYKGLKLHLDQHFKLAVTILGNKMPTITLSDVKGAIHYAWDMWDRNESRRFSYKLESGQDVNIILNKSGNMLNYMYGFPIMDKSNIPALKAWWQDDESKSSGGEGTFKDREKKSPGVYGVNVLCRAARTFNFHVPTT